MKHYEILAPDVNKEQKLKAIEMASKYADESKDFFSAVNFYCERIKCLTTEEMDYIFNKNDNKFIEMGIEAFDKHFEKMLDMENEPEEDVIQYYIEECLGWELRRL